MKFSALQKTSLIDFPNHIASVLFAPGCNLRCPFCHNWRIVVDPKPPFLNEEETLKTLERRKKYVDAIVITGGEPTIHKELPKFLERLKERDFIVKLDTNGFNPHVLKECLQYVDYVALDVKTSLEKYARLGAKDVTELCRTIEILKADNQVECEFRTTVVPGLVEEEDIIQIGELVKGAKTFAFQQFVPGDILDKNLNTLQPHTSETISKYSATIKNYVSRVILRL